jgi:XTP/dITP diphosphohydrolase
MLDVDLRTIVLATRNTGKLREFQTLLQPLESSVLGLTDVAIDRDIDESGTSFAENARLKALFYSGLTSLPVLADDSGLEVMALGGRPGIYSARYAGTDASDEDRNRKLLKELEDEENDRTARFFCALTMAKEGKILLEAEGKCRGVITHAPRGMNGFGYDPIFLFPEMDKTFAELNPEEKNRYSHRCRAVRNLLACIKGKTGSI